MQATQIAYCGLPPVPAELAQAWNFDPPLLAALSCVALLVGGLARHRRAGWAAFLLLVIVFVSPLCALTSALFSARVLHHVVLIAMVAPLLVLAFPPRRSLPLSPGAVFLLHWACVWLWHAPGPYVWALDTVAGYWLMQASLLLTAWLLWREVLGPTATPGRGLALLVGTVAQMGLLGALLVFAPEPLYLVHLTTTGPWGLSPLQDQQLGGLAMWVPAMLPYLAVALHIVWRELAEQPRPT